ncbi:nuclear transport factor 2 family protein [Paraburkholderia acidiphila]|uniref:Nuclear transport factor 2 family protein n=1 Tax=Paraburkholderia acidiphila TaxID=2571747 RepID=A0A7Z2G866_9BURK|nr:nuclear transport factor 2 family protein [Paraburkholderia acidiphila]QGZ56876.1 hypothetical protein FAZ97_18145 [Paraburkholderia acidiphila]
MTTADFPLLSNSFVGQDDDNAFLGYSTRMTITATDRIAYRPQQNTFREPLAEEILRFPFAYFREAGSNSPVIRLGGTTAPNVLMYPPTMHPAYVQVLTQPQFLASDLADESRSLESVRPLFKNSPDLLPHLHGPRKMSTRTTDIDAIQTVLDHYTEAVLHGKVDLARPLFHPQALMAGYMNGHQVLGTPAPFLDDVEHGPAQASLPHGYRTRVLSIEVYGATATVLFAEDRISVGQPDGSRIVMDIVDSFHLLCIADRWVIVSKLFYHDPV